MRPRPVLTVLDACSTMLRLIKRPVIEGTMLEITPLTQQIDDLQERYDSLRGYL